MNKIEFINSASTPESLTIAVIEQVGGWDDFTELAQDVADHGADAGFSGFISYSETMDFAQKNKRAIHTALADMADETGQTVTELVAGFNCLNGMSQREVEAVMLDIHEDSDDATAVLNALAWYALETVSREYADQMEDAQ